MECFYSQSNFLWSNFSTVKEIFHKKIIHDQGNFARTSKFFTVKEIYYKKTKILLHQGNFPQKKIFTLSKNFSANKDKKDSLKAKILDSFNTKSHAKIFLTF